MPSYYPAPRPPNYGSGERQGQTMLDLIMHQGQIRAQGAQQSGAIWGQALSNAGAGIGEAITQHAATQAVARRTQALDAVFNSPEPPSLGALVRVLGPKDGTDVWKGIQSVQPDAAKRYQSTQEQLRDASRGVLALPPERRQAGFQVAINGLVNSGVVKPEQVPEYSEELLTQYAGYGQEPAKATEGFTLTPGQQRFGPGGQPIAAVPAAPQDAPRPQVVGRSLVGPDGRVIYRDPAEPRGDAAAEPLMAVIGDDGQPVYLPRSRAVGRRPASTREQGRPVTSGDAGRVTELDTSLDDLRVLRETIAPRDPKTGELLESNTTGTGAAMGAALWNPITNATGIGLEAKQKQAVIDRVKQVIGKALEEGVLRKEDEIKYEKILPTVGDAPALVETKLAGLERAIAQRRARHLESLGDAGYDTARFLGRSNEPAAPPVRVNSVAEANALAPGTMYQTPDGKTMRR